jgi:hypothetical protein
MWFALCTTPSQNVLAKLVNDGMPCVEMVQSY